MLDLHGIIPAWICDAQFQEGSLSDVGCGRSHWIPAFAGMTVGLLG